MNIPGSLTSIGYRAFSGITYSVETSTDLRTWITDGVILSDLDPNKHRTASVDRDGPQRYLRLGVSENP